MALERTVSGDRFEYTAFQESDPNAIPREAWESADGLLVRHLIRIPSEIVQHLKKCRIIVRAGVGFDNVDIDACRRCGIPVCNVPNYGTTDVADHALALLLSLAKGIGAYEQRVRDDPIAAFDSAEIPVVRRIRGLTFGAVGLGRIGMAVARRARAFDMNVVFFDPYLSEGHDLAVGLERAETLRALLERADIVSLHVPLTDETREMIGPDQLSWIKRGAILINIARGRLINLDAVCAALQSGQLSAAGLDVLPEEPPPQDHPLLHAWRRREAWIDGRLVITPHSAYYSKDSAEDMRRLAVQVLSSYLDDGHLRNNVNAGWELHASSRSG
jgi:D-3-phosphoglycerate dehydrogenase